jgi:hypothetical protein
VNYCRLIADQFKSDRLQISKKTPIAIQLPYIHQVIFENGYLLKKPFEFSLFFEIHGENTLLKLTIIKIPLLRIGALKP